MLNIRVTKVSKAGKKKSLRYILSTHIQQPFPHGRFIYRRNTKTVCASRENHCYLKIGLFSYQYSVCIQRTILRLYRNNICRRVHTHTHILLYIKKLKLRYSLSFFSFWDNFPKLLAYELMKTPMCSPPHYPLCH